MRAFAAVWFGAMVAWFTLLLASGRWILAALFFPFVVLSLGIAAYWRAS